MGDADVRASTWRLVERGRVVLFMEGEYEGKLGVIVQIIDHKRVLLDNPTKESPVPRHACRLAQVALTQIVIPDIPVGARTSVVRELWEQHEVNKKWDESNWAKNRAKSAKRRQLTDFERFKVMRLRKSQRFEVRKSMAKIRATAKA